MGNFDHVLYHHINVNEDKEAALADSKTFLDLYYGANYSKERLEAWLTYGSPRDCIEASQALQAMRLQAHHVPDFHHGRSDDPASPRRRRGAAVRLTHLRGCKGARSVTVITDVSREGVR